MMNVELECYHRKVATFKFYTLCFITYLNSVCMRQHGTLSYP